MKITVRKYTKNFIFPDEFDALTRLADVYKTEYADKIEDDVKTALDMFCGHHTTFDFVCAEALIRMNHRVWHYYDNKSYSADIWIEALVKIEGSYCEVKFYLSDLYQGNKTQMEVKLFTPYRYNNSPIDVQMFIPAR